MRRNTGVSRIEVLTSLCMLIGVVAGIEIKIPDAYMQENPCNGKHGVILPNLYKCNEFFVCVDGLKEVGSCGNDHFDARRSVCDKPSLAGCVSFGPEPVPLTQSICLDKKDGTKLPANDSASKYFLCKDGYAQLEDCGQLTFDRDVQTCVPPKQLRPLLPPCSGKKNGARVPVDYDPRKYYLCMNNRPFLKSCGDLLFSAKTSSCILKPQESRVQSGEYQVAAVVDSQPRENPIPDNVEEESAQMDVVRQPILRDRLALRICQGLKLGTRIPIPGTCAQYYICMGNSGILKSCGRMQFNPETAACDLASNVQCSVRQGVAVYEPKETPADHQPATSSDLTICQGEKDASLLPASGNCSQYYFCYKNDAILKSCGKRHFNPVSMSCVDLADSVCVDKASALQGHLPVRETTVDCLNSLNGDLLQHPTDCGKFLMCDNQMAIEMECPAGLHFNVNKNYCDWPELANCS